MHQSETINAMFEERNHQNLQKLGVVWFLFLKIIFYFLKNNKNKEYKKNIFGSSYQRKHKKHIFK